MRIGIDEIRRIRWEWICLSSAAVIRHQWCDRVGRNALLQLDHEEVREQMTGWRARSGCHDCSCSASVRDCGLLSLSVPRGRVSRSNSRCQLQAHSQYKRSASLSSLPSLALCFVATAESNGAKKGRERRKEIAALSRCMLCFAVLAVLCSSRRCS